MGVLNIILNSEKGTGAAAAEAIYGHTSSTAKIVLQLMAEYLRKGKLYLWPIFKIRYGYVGCLNIEILLSLGLRVLTA